MIDGGPSRTAVAAALMRAAHTRRDRPVIFADPWAERLVSEEEKDAFHRRALAGVSPESRAKLERVPSRDAAIDAVLRRHPTYGGVVIRSRYAEDALAAAVTRGVRQYVLLGAGLDSFALRQPAFARDLTIFEVDHPATQTSKRARIAACGVAEPANVRFAAADLANEPLGTALDGAGFAHDVPAFFSWLGVTVYLTRDANLATLRAVAAVAAPGSEIVFTYMDQRILDGGFPAVEAMRAKRAAEGEPWVSGFDPRALADDLRACGLTLVEDVGPEDLTERFCRDRTDGLAPGRAGHLALARV